MNKKLQALVSWGTHDADDFAELWDTEADDIVGIDPEGCAKLRAFAQAVRDAGDHFRGRGEGK